MIRTLSGTNLFFALVSHNATDAFALTGIPIKCSTIQTIIVSFSRTFLLVAVVPGFLLLALAFARVKVQQATPFAITRPFSRTRQSQAAGPLVPPRKKNIPTPSMKDILVSKRVRNFFF